MNTTANKPRASTPGNANRSDRAEASHTGGRSRKPRGAGLGGFVQSVGAHARSNPIAAVAGAVAVSAGLALLLPASRREAEVMGEVADKLGDTAREIADSAVEAGRNQVEALAQTALAGVSGALVEAVVSVDASAGGTNSSR